MPSTVRLRTAHLRTLARAGHPDPWAVTRADLVLFLGRPGMAPESRRSYRSTFRTFYAWAGIERHLRGQSPAATLPAVRVPIPLPRVLDDSVIVRALRAAPARTLLMLRLMAELGLRRAETAAADTRRVEAAGYRVLGKGGRERVVPLPDDLRGVLAGLPAGWVFPGRIDGHLSPGTVGKLVGAVLPAGATPHMLRHSAATAWHEAGLDIAEISPLLGHSSVATTQRYVRPRIDRQREAVRQAAARLYASQRAAG